MSFYTTGEMANKCGVTVRTVQYYDNRGVLVPSELTDGGRRLYSEEDLRRLRIICFLRELGLPLDAVSQIMAEPNAGNVIMELLRQREVTVTAELRGAQEQLDKLKTLQQQLRADWTVSADSIGDIAYVMANNDKLKRVHATMLAWGIPVAVFQWVAIVLWIVKGWWWLFVLWVVLAIPEGIILSRYYIKHVAYVCPECHTVFKPAVKEMFRASHTTTTRKLTCTACGHEGFCVEVYDEGEAK